MTSVAATYIVLHFFRRPVPEHYSSFRAALPLPGRRHCDVLYRSRDADVWAVKREWSRKTDTSV